MMEYPTELVAKAKYELAVFERVSMDTGAELVSEVERLRAALLKIGDWHGAWGPYPEANEDWRAMAVVTAREAVRP